MNAPGIATRRRQLRDACAWVVPGFDVLAPAEEFRRIAAWCEAHDVEHDSYGQGELVEGFERKLSALLGKPAAVFMPSGVMAQLAAVRVWAESAGLFRFGMHPTSHLALHEEQAHAALMHCHGVPVGVRWRPMTAPDLDAVKQPLACLIVELPIRESGGLLPTWDELLALETAARQRGVALHMDGARLWESLAHYGKTPAQVAERFDSVYVSLYKGVGALSGAVLAGGDDFISQARLWRRRMGGTLYHLSPMVVSAAMRFDERLALMPALYQRTREVAAALQPVPHLRLNPEEPQTNMFHLFFDTSAERLLEARDALAAEHGCWLFDNAWPAPVPGWSATEIYVGERLLRIDDARLVAWFAQLCEAMRAPGA